MGEGLAASKSVRFHHGSLGGRMATGLIGHAPAADVNAPKAGQEGESPPPDNPA